MGQSASTQLYAAAQRGDVEFLERVFSSGSVHINSSDEMGLTALHVCALHGKTDAVRRLIELGGNVNQETFDDCHTPLHLAAMRDQVGAANELVLAGAKATARDSTGQTPLHYAAGEGSVFVTRFLIEGCGVPISITNNSQLSPLDCAVANGHVNVARVIFANDPSAWRDTLKFSGNTALHYAASSPNAAATVRYLIMAGVDPHLINKEFALALHVAAGANEADVCLYFARYCGVDVHCSNAQGLSPLAVAILNGALEAAKVLIETEPSTVIYRSAGDGQTALHHAVQAVANDESLLKMLLAPEYNLSIDGLDNIGRRPIDVAKTHDKKHLLPSITAARDQRALAQQQQRIQQAGGAGAAAAAAASKRDGASVLSEEEIEEALRQEEEQKKLLQLAASKHDSGSTTSESKQESEAEALLKRYQDALNQLETSDTRPARPKLRTEDSVVAGAPSSRPSGPTSRPTVLPREEEGQQQQQQSQHHHEGLSIDIPPPVEDLALEAARIEHKTMMKEINQVLGKDVDIDPPKGEPKTDVIRPKAKEGLTPLAQSMLKATEAKQIDLVGIATRPVSLSAHATDVLPDDGYDSEDSVQEIVGLAVSTAPTNLSLGVRDPKGGAGGAAPSTSKFVTGNEDLLGTILDAAASEMTKGGDAAAAAAKPTNQPYDLDSVVGSGGGGGEESVSEQAEQYPSLTGATPVWLRVHSSQECGMGDVDWAGCEFPIVFGRWQRDDGKKISVLLPDDLQVDVEHCVITLADFDPKEEKSAEMFLEVLGRGGVGVDGRWIRLGDPPLPVRDGSILSIGKRRLEVEAPRSRPFGGLHEATELERVHRARVRRVAALSSLAAPIPAVRALAPYSKSRLLGMLPTGGLVKARAVATRRIQRVYRGHVGRNVFRHTKFLRDSRELEWLKKNNFGPDDGYGELSEDKLFWDDIRLKLQALEKKIERLSINSAARRVQLLWSYREKCLVSKREFTWRKKRGPEYKQRAALLLQSAWRVRNARRELSSRVMETAMARSENKRNALAFRIQLLYRSHAAKNRFRDQETTSRPYLQGLFARRIQRTFRIHQAKSVFGIALRLHHATVASKLVAVVRGHFARQRIKVVRQMFTNFGAATRIKAVFRGHMARRIAAKLMAVKIRAKQQAAAAIIVRAALVKAAKNHLKRRRRMAVEGEKLQREQAAVLSIVGAIRTHNAKKVQKIQRVWYQNYRIDWGVRTIQRYVRRWTAQIRACVRHAKEETMIKRLATSVAPMLTGCSGPFSVSRHRAQMLEVALGPEGKKSAKRFASRWWNGVILRLSFLPNSRVEKKVRKRVGEAIETRGAMVIQRLFARKAHRQVTKNEVIRHGHLKRIQSASKLASVYRGHIGRTEYRTEEEEDKKLKRERRILNAANSLQCAWLVRNARRAFREQSAFVASLRRQAATLCLQLAFRSKLSRKKLRSVQLQRENAAAVCLQCSWRVRRARHATRNTRIFRRRLSALLLQRAYRQHRARVSLFSKKLAVIQGAAARVLQGLFYKWRRIRFIANRRAMREQQALLEAKVQAEEALRQTMAKVQFVWLDGFASVDVRLMLDNFITLACRDGEFLEYYERGAWDVCGDMLVRVLDERGQSTTYQSVRYNRDTLAMVFSVAAFCCEYASRLWRSFKSAKTGEGSSDTKEMALSLVETALRLTTLNAMPTSAQTTQSRLRLRSWALDLRAGISFHEGKFAEAVQYVKAALQLEEAAPNVEGRAVWNMHLAVCLSRDGNHHASRKAFVSSRQALSEAEALLAQHGRATGDQPLGLVGAWSSVELRPDHSAGGGLKLLRTILMLNMAVAATNVRRFTQAQGFTRLAIRALILGRHDIGPMRKLREMILSLDAVAVQIQKTFGSAPDDKPIKEAEATLSQDLASFAIPDDLDQSLAEKMKRNIDELAQSPPPPFDRVVGGVDEFAAAAAAAENAAIGSPILSGSEGGRESSPSPVRNRPPPMSPQQGPPSSPTLTAGVGTPSRASPEKQLQSLDSPSSVKLTPKALEKSSSGRFDMKPRPTLQSSSKEDGGIVLTASSKLNSPMAHGSSSTPTAAAAGGSQPGILGSLIQASENATVDENGWFSWPQQSWSVSKQLESQQQQQAQSDGGFTSTIETPTASAGKVLKSNASALSLLSNNSGTITSQQTAKTNKTKKDDEAAEAKKKKKAAAVETPKRSKGGDNADVLSVDSKKKSSATAAVSSSAAAPSSGSGYKVAAAMRASSSAEGDRKKKSNIDPNSSGDDGGNARRRKDPFLPPRPATTSPPRGGATSSRKSEEKRTKKVQRFDDDEDEDNEDDDEGDERYTDEEVEGDERRKGGKKSRGGVGGGARSSSPPAVRHRKRIANEEKERLRIFSAPSLQKKSDKKAGGVRLPPVEGGNNSSGSRLRNASRESSSLASDTSSLFGGASGLPPRSGSVGGKKKNGSWLFSAVDATMVSPLKVDLSRATRQAGAPLGGLGSDVDEDNIWKNARAWNEEERLMKFASLVDARSAVASKIW